MPTVIYIGDSTVARNNIHTYPQTGMSGFLAKGLEKLNAPYACLLAGSDEGAHV